MNFEISHVFTYKKYTPKQRMIQWFWHMVRNILNLFFGIVGILTLGLIDGYGDIPAIILKNDLDFYKENYG